MIYCNSFLSGKFYEKGRKTVKHTVVYIDGMTCINCQDLEGAEIHTWDYRYHSQL